MILGTADPFFNEPGYDSMQGNAQGRARSRAYNAEQRYNTLAHSVLPALKKAPAGCEEAVRCGAAGGGWGA